MDRRTLLAISICFLIIMGWQKFYLEPRMAHQSAVVQQPVQQNPTASSSSPQQNNPSTGTASISKVDKTERPLEVRALDVKAGTAMVSNGSRFFSDWNLKTYKRGISPEATAIDLKLVT